MLDIIGLLEDNKGGKRSENRASVDDDCQKLMDRVREYYDAIGQELTDDEWKNLCAKARMTADEAFREFSEKTGETVKSDFVAAFMQGYQGEAPKRMCEANCKEIIKIISGSITDKNYDRTKWTKALAKTLSKWPDDRAEEMARYEESFLRNKAYVTACEAMGYISIWAAPTGECNVCAQLNGVRIKKITPPLHKGCNCYVDIGEKLTHISAGDSEGDTTGLWSAANFGSITDAYKHIKHVRKDYAGEDMSFEDYVRRARTVMNMEEEEGVVEKHEDGKGKRFKFIRKTGELAIGATVRNELVLVTLFKPKETDYWEETVMKQ